MSPFYIVTMITGALTGWLMNYIVHGRKAPLALDSFLGIISVFVLSGIINMVFFNMDDEHYISLLLGIIISILLAIFVKKMT